MSMPRALLLVTLVAACGGKGSSSGPAGDMSPATPTLTASTTSVTPYQVLGISSNVALSGSVTAMTSDGTQVAAALVDGNDLVLVVPNAPGDATITISVGANTFPSIALTIGAAPTLPTDSATYVMQYIADAQQHLATMAGSATDATTMAMISASQQNLTDLQTKFEALSADDQSAAAAFLYANAQSAELSFTAVLAFTATAARVAGLAALVVELAVPVGITLAGAIVIGAGLGLANSMPDLLTATNEMLGDPVVEQGDPTAGIQTDTDPTPISFTSSQAAPLILTASFDAVQPSDTSSSDPAVAQAAGYENSLPPLLVQVDQVVAFPYPALPTTGVSMTETLEGQYLTFDPTSVTNGVTVVDSTSDADGPVLTFQGPGTCTQFTFAVTYDDGMDPSSQISVAAQIDCEMTSTCAQGNPCEPGAGCAGGINGGPTTSCTCVSGTFQCTTS